MKFVSKLLSLLLAAVQLGSLLPTTAFAASGTESDPIPLKVGETVQHTPGEDVFYTFTPEEDGVYTVLMEATAGSIIEPADQPVPLADNGGRGLSGYLLKGETYKLKGLGNMAWVQVINEGRLYSKMYDDEYLLWDFDPEKGTLTIDPGQGDGEMRPYAGDRHEFPWYYIEGQIKHVVIGEGVTSVSPHAFDTSSLFDSIEAFAALEDVSFPSTLKSIGKYAFYKCPSLKTVTFPAALETIDEYAFFYCTGLESVTFEGPTSIIWPAFELCEALEDVTVKDPNMTDFGFRPFFNSPWVRTVAAENKGAVVVNNVLIGAWQAWDKEKGDGILIIPDGVTKIAAGALHGITTDPAGGEEGYQDNWYLEEVVIPDSVTELVEDEFFGGPFDSCTDLERVTIGNGVTTIPFGCFEDDFELRIVNFGKNVRRIEANAFKNTFLPGDVAIPDTVESIGKQAFQLTEVSLGASWVEDNLGDKPYRPKDFLNRTVYMGPNLTEIGAKAFDGWESGWDGVFTIQGYDGTYAQQWAKNNNYPYESLGAAPTTPTTPVTPTTPEPPTTPSGFADVPAGAYFADAVKWAVDHDPQITNGTSANTFSPNATCTRAQVVTFLWRAAGCPAHSGESDNFSDVPAGAYYSDAVAWAVEEGITSGTGNGTFSPNAACNRGQVVTFLFRFEGVLPVSGGAPFTDVDARAYYADAVAWAVEENVTQGTSATTFSPDTTCTRGQIVTFLYRDMA